MGAWGARMSDTDSEITIKEVGEFLRCFGDFRHSRITAGMYSSMNLQGEVGSLATNNLITDYKKQHKESADSLVKKLSFQHWLERKDVYQHSNQLVSKGKLNVYIVGDEDNFFIPDIYSRRQEIEWRLQYIFACGIFAYTCAELMDVGMSQFNFSTQRSFSEKTKQSAKKLIRNIREDDVEIPAELIGQLNTIIRKNDFGEVGLGDLDINISSVQRRRYAICQICCVGSQEFLPTKSPFGRFFPDIVVDILKLVGEETDTRTVQFIMEPYDKLNLGKMGDDQMEQFSWGIYNHGQWGLRLAGLDEVKMKKSIKSFM